MVVQGLLQSEQDKWSLKEGIFAANYVELRDESLELQRNQKQYFGNGSSYHTCEHYIFLGVTSCDMLQAAMGDFLTQVVLDPVATPSQRRGYSLCYRL